MHVCLLNSYLRNGEHLITLIVRHTCYHDSTVQCKYHQTSWKDFFMSVAIKENGVSVYGSWQFSIQQWLHKSNLMIVWLKWVWIKGTKTHCVGITNVTTKNVFYDNIFGESACRKNAITTSYQINMFAEVCKLLRNGVSIII